MYSNKIIWLNFFISHKQVSNCFSKKNEASNTGTELNSIESSLGTFREIKST